MRGDFVSFLSAVGDAAIAARASVAALGTRRVVMELPLEVVWRVDAEGTRLDARLPVWRWPTDFDRAPGRVRVTWGEEDAL